ncbi:PIN domain-containing protein [Nonomuraea sp. NN258]|uniref:PIN domain-containing protein n=1 Tax=Nonomuraea antri TaxID=2730852 RepID=UPI0015689A95|nr:PIN domain-containing protein [Nonomuraea antri]NRQ32071.1 PIN domain-containing protein [Nonomuraea antri]
MTWRNTAGSRARNRTSKSSCSESWLERLHQEFRTRVLPVTDAVAEEWGHMPATRPLPIVDGLSAATARAHDWILVRLA